jgi:hypothetical protein
MKPLVMQFSPPSRHSIPLRQKSPCSRTPAVIFSLCSGYVPPSMTETTFRTHTEPQAILLSFSTADEKTEGFGPNGSKRYQNSISSEFVRFEVFTAVTMKNGVFWDVTPCGSCKNRRLRGARFLRNVGSYKSHTA